MKTTALVMFLLCLGWPLGAMGSQEDPQKTSTRTYPLKTIQSLSVRGEVQLTVTQGAKGSLTITTNRALFDQMKVSRWFGSVSVAIQTGLKGPREVGLVEVVAVVPRLEALEVLDASSARLEWPGGTAKVSLRGGSRLELVFEGTKLTLEADSDSGITVSGSAKSLVLSLRNSSTADMARFNTGAAVLTLGEGSQAVLGEVGTWSGTLRQGSQAVSVGIQEPKGTLNAY